MGIKPTEISESALQSSILERIRWIFDPVDMDQPAVRRLRDDRAGEHRPEPAGELLE